jgi:hypothetical protein
MCIAVCIHITYIYIYIYIHGLNYIEIIFLNINLFLVHGICMKTLDFIVQLTDEIQDFYLLYLKCIHLCIQTLINDFSGFNGTLVTKIQYSLQEIL